ncbi:uncharacterized protein F5891DRAFT_1194715 [Suillus fuscotomentosus]|uniref:Uncharacterized protein n=1 Tax=Suillus fuscotomentosus TaxID=1912939 RepID=A0AAD4DW10_9AGAM|nr:uncharacterized protein F5891DRAFT_1194715 [Suillus fuscotomentosus]KAG1894905.1 hypothetical protein F5891DRAFT_1194715 [Suillus fuscotomentosus]
MQNQTHSPNLARYVIQSSDVISDLRINVFEEGHDNVMWYKERFLGDDEIIEHVVHNQTSTICWTIHKPKRGWYIRIRAPSFPPGVSISLLPIPRTSPNYIDAALSLSCLTNTPSTVIHSPSTSKMSIDSTSTVHSYPPTPPPASIMITPPTPQSISARNTILVGTAFYTTHPGAATRRADIIPIRALSMFKNNRPSHSASFTITPLNRPSPQPPGSGHRISQIIPMTPTPLLTFHDRTPLLTLASVTGLLEINRAEERILGIDTSFWIAVALAYWDFLEDRESYLAAVSD